MAAEGTSAIREAARAIASRGNCVALTGAGISVESGVPAFRGAQGLWDRFDPMEYATIGAFRKDPGKVWRMPAEMIEILGRAAPNPAHRGIAELESLGLLRSVITQNVDGLHQAAGSRGVVEFHGSARELVCLFCPNRYPTREKVLEGIPPRCGCGAILKPDIIFFGEQIPRAAMETAESEAEAAAVLLVVGTSAEVTPACGIPLLARRQGALIVEINPEETVLTRSISDAHLRESAGTALPKILAEIRKSTGAPPAAPG